MKYLFLVLSVVTLIAATASAQPPRVPVKVEPRNVPFKTVTEVSEADWRELSRVLNAEDWSKAATLAAGHLRELTKENASKQLAQLRYQYLFALSGQILQSNDRGDTAGAEKALGELDLAIEKFINKELLLPPRPFTMDCAKKLNVICPAKETPNAYRSTATNQAGSGIHSFDWVTFPNAPDIKEFEGKLVFMGGTLRRVEFNEDKTKPWVIRMFMNDGNLRVVIKV